MDVSKPQGKGHRKRLREKLLRSGLAAFQDYEIIELLLTLGTPRKDCKAQAKEAIERFKGLRGVLAAPLEELQEVRGVGPHSAFGIKLVQEVARAFLKEEILDKPLCSSSQEVFAYLYHAMRDLRKEVLKAVFLDGQNRIIEVENLFEGTLNLSPVYPREIFKSAIRHHALSFIVVHNHPSGNPEPSSLDRELTKDLVFAGNVMQITVLDHIIIGDNRYYSFADQGLMAAFQRQYVTWRRSTGIGG